MDDRVGEISVDRARCMGAGMCAFMAPNTFDLDDEGISTVVAPDGDPFERVEAAARECPTQAIAVSRDRPVGRPTL